MWGGVPVCVRVSPPPSARPGKRGVFLRRVGERKENGKKEGNGSQRGDKKGGGGGRRTAAEGGTGIGRGGRVRVVPHPSGKGDAATEGDAGGGGRGAVVSGRGGVPAGEPSSRGPSVGCRAGFLRVRVCPCVRPSPTPAGAERCAGVGQSEPRARGEGAAVENAGMGLRVPVCAGRGMLPPRLAEMHA